MQSRSTELVSFTEGINVEDSSGIRIIGHWNRGKAELSNTVLEFIQHKPAIMF
jgi:hypothetical protein